MLSEDGCVCASLFHLLDTDGWTKVATWFRNCHSDAERSASLYTKLNLRARVLGKIEKDSFITLPDKGGHSGILPQKTMCLNLERIVRSFMIQKGCDQLADILLMGWW